jgi:FkbH-like protein
MSDIRDGGRTIKCVVWDLDDTIWRGTLLEGDDVALREGIVETLAALDGRGILHSIASRNDADAARAKLTALGIESYFLYPQINWNAKSASIAAIASRINIGLDAIAFVDDQAAERDEVAAAHPSVLCLEPSPLAALVTRPELSPQVVSDDARQRRLRYRADEQRQNDEAEYVGPPDGFLASLGLVCTIRRASVADLDRAIELTERTHQLNSTGYTYTRDELAARFVASDADCLTVTLSDKYGDYGTVGLSVSAVHGDVQTLQLLLTSCRVISRGVGTILLHHIMQRAHARGRTLLVEMIPTSRNRLMEVTFAFAGFKTIGWRGNVKLLGHDLSQIPAVPSYVTLVTDAPAVAAVELRA